EQAAAAQHQPGLVAVPHRRHGVDRLVALAADGEHREQDADAQVEAVHHHVGEHREQDDAGPDHGEVESDVHHGSSPDSFMPGPGMMPAVRIGPDSSLGPGSLTCTPAAISRRMYQVPKPNTT